VKLIAPQFVKPYVKANKTDAVDAEAISEAATRPTMRFVPVKTADQQAALSLHRARVASGERSIEATREDPRRRLANGDGAGGVDR
jgi:transposase